VRRTFCGNKAAIDVDLGMSNQRILKPNAAVTVSTKKIEGYKLKNLGEWTYSNASQSLQTFKLTCSEEDLVEEFQNQNVKVGSSEYRFVECPICYASCEEPRFYCAAKHVFCKMCLEHYERSEQEFNCPCCRQVYTGYKLTRLGKLTQSNTTHTIKDYLKCTRLRLPERIIFFIGLWFFFVHSIPIFAIMPLIFALSTLAFDFWIVWIAHH
jgi:hypothetical protein